MTLYMSQNLALEEPARFYVPNENLVITGDISSNSDIFIVAKTIVIVGKVFTTAKLFITAERDLIQLGVMKSENLDFKVGGIFHEGVHINLANKLRPLGVQILICKESNTTQVTTTQRVLAA